MSDDIHLKIRDLRIDKLVPRGRHKTSSQHYQRLEDSVRAVGLIEPLVVCDQGDCYAILDGNLRYEILQEMGMDTVPCLISESPPTNPEPTHE
jgi:ParB-like chromosome segregation protein Spo0J